MSQTRPSPPRLTIAMIVKNEATNLADCLASCKGLSDEILIVDAGSTDATLDIACEFGARVIEQSDWQGFGYQRRFAQTHIQTDWVFWIDADERLTPELTESILRVLEQPPSEATIFRVNRLSWVFGQFIRHSGWYPDRVARLYQTNYTQYSDSAVHEHVLIPQDSRVVGLNGDLLHYTYRDLEHYLVKSANYASLWAQQRAKAGKRSSLLLGILHGLGCFLRMYVLKAGFMDGKAGLLLAILSAHSTFAKYADLWVRQRTR
jgi:(heptosyl)LPS beta-1,4-glucosyltransferase